MGDFGASLGAWPSVSLPSSKSSTNQNHSAGQPAPQGDYCGPARAGFCFQGLKDRIRDPAPDTQCRELKKTCKDSFASVIYSVFTPKGLRPLAQGWRTRLPWVNGLCISTPKGLRRIRRPRRAGCVLSPAPATCGSGRQIGTPIV